MKNEVTSVARKDLPQRKAWSQVLSDTNMIVAILTMAAALIGGGWALVEYLERGAAAQVKESFALVELWESQGYKADFEKLDSAIIKHYSALGAETLRELSDMDPETKLLATGNIGRVIIAQSDNPDVIKESIDNLVYFFTRAQICIEEELCSESVVNAFFNTNVNSFWTHINGYVEDKRSNYHSSYGVRLQALVDSKPEVKDK